MVEWYYFAGGGVIIFLISLLFEPIRDFFVDIIEDIFGDFGDGIVYVITFEWVSDIPEFFSTIWEGISEFSIYGITFGALTSITLYLLSDWTLQPFLQYYSPMGKMIWGIATYVGTFIVGYMMGVFYENS